MVYLWCKSCDQVEHVRTGTRRSADHMRYGFLKILDRGTCSFCTKGEAVCDCTNGRVYNNDEPTSNMFHECETCTPQQKGAQ